MKTRRQVSRLFSKSNENESNLVCVPWRSEEQQKDSSERNETIESPTLTNNTPNIEFLFH